MCQSEDTVFLKKREFKDVKGPVDFIKYFFQDVVLTKHEILYVIAISVIVLELYGALLLAIGNPFLPPKGPAWAILLIWVIAGSCGYLVDKLHFPGALAMILSGVLLRNVNDGVIISGLVPSWSKQIRAAALAIIFLRSGLEIDLDIFRRVGLSAVRLLLVPGIVEAFFDGAIAMPIFGMPPTFAFALGFILKAVGPALVIQAMFEVQQKRLGAVKSIPATVVAAASFDDAIAITGYTLFINLAVREGGNTTWSVMHGPLSLVFGLLAGVLAGFMCSITKLWDNSFKRTLVMFFSILLMKFFFDHFGFTSSGAIAALVQGLLAKELWKRGIPSKLAVESGPQMGRSVEKQVRWFWRFIMSPLMFGLVGASVNFKTIDRSIIPKAVAIIVSGLGVRMPVTFLVMSGSKFTFLEKLFFAIAWSPKATVQATLANLPMDQVQSAYAPTDPAYAENMRWAEEALVTAVFCIIICGAWGTLSIRYLAPFLLQKAPEDDDHTTQMVQGPSSSLPPSVRPSPTPSQIELSKLPVYEGPQQQQQPQQQQHPPAPTTPRAATGGGALPPPSPKDVESELLRTHMQVLSTYVDSVEEAATEVERKAMTADGGGLVAERLQRSIIELRKKLQEGSELQTGPQEVESADDFLRATALRHRSASSTSRSLGSVRSRRHIDLGSQTLSTNV
ncbi:g10197 [Coccomyxa viridis]|uniref:G10197 protein n=1 Tax=Coccomyxa viridis TaxID=1274662 RepID=A0ABP1G4Z0_9CHLO